MLKFLRGGRHTAAIWWLIIITTAVAFVIGFSVAPNLVDQGQVSASTVLGSVGGDPVTQEEWAAKQAELVQNFRLQRGSDPEGRDLAQLREQAWVQLLTEKALSHESRRLGYRAGDPEVLYAVRNMPPAYMQMQPVFQTNGRFDLQKYQAMLNDPEINWAPIEEETRQTLPAQKLEERLIAAAKFSEPELRRAFRDQYEMVSVTVARWMEPATPIDTTRFTDDVLRRYYDEHKTEFAGPAEASATLVLLPKTIADEDRSGVRERARALAEEARAGGDFAQLARDNSEAPNAQQGGDLGRDIPLSELPPAVAQPVGAVRDSAILDPILESGRYYVLKVRRVPEAPVPTYRVAQIMLSVMQSEASRAADIEKIERLRKQAKDRGLGRAAAAMGLGAQETGWFSESYFVPQLVNLPQAQQFALAAEEGDLSPGYDADQGYVVLQVTGKRPAGVRPFETVKQEVKQAAIRAEKLKPMVAAAQRAVQRMRAGASFEEAARGEGAAAVEQTQPFSRQQPAYQVSASPRAVGVAFGLPMGAISDPMTTQAGVIVMRKDGLQTVSDASYDSLKAGVSRLLLSNRQQRSVTAWIDWLRQKAGIRDVRGEKLAIQ